MKSARYCTKAITADSSACSVTPPSSSTIVDVPRRLAADSPYTISRAPSDPTKVANGTAEMPSSETSRSNVIAIIAPSDAPAETPSVSGDANGLRSSA